MNTLDTLWQWILDVTLRGSALIVVVLAFRWLAGRRIPASYLRWLWILVAIRLLAPIVPHTSWSIFNLLEHRTATFSTFEPENQWHVSWGKRVTLPHPSQSETATVTPPATTTGRAVTWTFTQCLAAVWLVGTALQTFLLFAGTIRLQRSFRSAPRLSDPRLNAIADECAQQLKLRCPIEIVTSSAGRGPVVTGLFKPYLLLPPGLPEKLSDEELRYLLLHEFAHIQKLDLPVAWLLRIARAVHWFNPVVWLAAVKAEEDAEFACDEAVMRQNRHAGDEQYGETLLRLIQVASQRSLPVPAAGIGRNRRALQERLSRIVTYEPPTRSATVIALGFVLLAGIAFGANESKAPLKTIEAKEPIRSTVSLGGSSKITLPATATPAPEINWSILDILLPASPLRDGHRSPDQSIEVDVKKPDGTVVQINRESHSAGGLWVEKIDPASANELLALRENKSPEQIKVILRNGKERIPLTAPPRVVAVRGEDRIHVELSGKFFEVNPTRLRMLQLSSERIAGEQHDGLAELDTAIAPFVLTPTQTKTLVHDLSVATNLLSAPKVTTSSEQRCVIEIIREVRVVKEWEKTVPIAKSKVTLPKWSPKKFETMNCGATFEFEPDVEASGLIRIEAKPMLVELAGFRDLDNEEVFPAKRDFEKPISERSLEIPKLPDAANSGRRLQAQFSIRTTSATISLLDGYSIIFPDLPETQDLSAFPNRGPDKRIITVVTVRLLHGNGTPVSP